MTAPNTPSNPHPASPPAESVVPVLAAVIAEFPSADAVKTAAKRFRAEGWTNWDVHSPYPIHGIDEAIGIRPTRLAWITLAFGGTGICAGLLLQWWTNAVAYPFLISGKPFFGLPGATPVCFELMILFAAISTLVSMLLLNGLPKFSNPLFDSSRFLRATNDRFFICVSARDPKFNRDAIIKSLEECHATAIDECFLPPPSATKFPVVIPAVFLLLITVALVPPLVIAWKRSINTTEPRFHAIFDMDFQPKFKAQRTSTIFADGRAMRPQVAGTVARGDLRADSRLYKGLEPEGTATKNTAQANPNQKLRQAVLASAGHDGVHVEGKLVSLAEPASTDPTAAGAPATPPDPLDSMPWVKTFPVTVNAKTMKRGQERYNIYCATCHGLAGDGDGLITRRAMELEQGTWVKPVSFHTPNVRNQPVGRLFHSISNGVRKMPGYADLIPVEDRWAILLYVKALQQTRTGELKDVPSELVPQLHDVPKE